MTAAPAQRNLPAMAVGSILLAALSLLCIPLGVLTTPIPVVGGIFSFGAPVLALTSVVMGGVAMSRAKRTGEATGAALAGVIGGSVAFVPALMTALTCGVCNALFTNGQVETHRDFSFGVQQVAPPVAPDAAVAAQPPPEPAPVQRTPGTPPPAFPPPPLAPKAAP